MNPTKLLLLKENGTFDRRPLHKMESDGKEYLLAVLEKIELLHSRLVPKSASRYWILYFTVVVLFIVVGFHKKSVNSTQLPLPQPKTRVAPGHNPPSHHNNDNMNHQRHPPHRPPPPEHHSPHNPPQGPRAGMPLPPHGSNSLEQRIKDLTGGRYAYRPDTDMKHYMRVQFKWYLYFVIETFLLCFPPWFLLKRKKQRKSALLVLEEFIEIENRQLITTHRCKLSFKGHTALTLTEFSEEKSDESKGNSEQTRIKLYCNGCFSSVKTSDSSNFDCNAIFD